MRRTLVPVAAFAARRAFSLIEVVIALGIVTFCLFALLGLLTVGAQANHDSTEVVQATTIATVLMSQVHASPTNASPSTFPILPFTNATPTTNVVFVAPDCTLLTGSATNYPGYRLTYTSSTNAFNTALIYFCLSWPSTIDPKVNPSEVKGRYEFFTCFPVPY